MTGEVDEDEEDISELVLSCILREVLGGVQFGHFFDELVQDRLRRVPIEADACKALLQFQRTEKGGETLGDPVERARFAATGTFGGFRRLPVAGLLLGAFLVALRTKDMGVPVDHLLRDLGRDAFGVEKTRFVGHLPVVDHLQKQIAQFALKLVPGLAFDGVCHLIGFFDGIGRDGGEGLFDVPGAPRFRVTEAAHHLDQLGPAIWGIEDWVGHEARSLAAMAMGDRFHGRAGLSTGEGQDMALEDAKSEVDRALSGEATGLAYENVFAGVTSFLRRSLTKDPAGADLAVMGVPFDQAVTHRPGARFGPRAIREASSLMAGDVPYGWGYSPLERFRVVDTGDMAFDYAKPAEVPGLIEARAAAVLASGAACLTLGGDHSITLPLLRAHVARHGPVALLQFDAHPDTWADNAQDRVDHGTFVYKALQEGLIDAGRSVQIGMRVEVEGEGKPPVARFDARAVHASDILPAVREVLGDGPVYLTFDIDVLDPAFAPGTGTPVWGGLTTVQAGLLLRGLAGIDLIGADVVEVSPPYDHADITAIAAAHVAYELVALWGWSRR